MEKGPVGSIESDDNSHEQEDPRENGKQHGKSLEKTHFAKALKARRDKHDGKERESSSCSARHCRHHRLLALAETVAARAVFDAAIGVGVERAVLEQFRLERAGVERGKGHHKIRGHGGGFGDVGQGRFCF